MCLSRTEGLRWPMKTQSPSGPNLLALENVRYSQTPNEDSMKTMGVHITTIVYLKTVIMQIGYHSNPFFQ